jgi:HlyD family secretion protein
MSVILLRKLPPAALAAPAPPSSHRPRHPAPHLLALGAGLFAALGALILLFQILRPVRPAPLRGVTEAVVQAPVRGVLELPAMVQPSATVRVAAEAPGRAIAVAVQPGDRVQRNQVLARIDIPELRAQAAGAEAQVVAAEADVHEAEVRLERLMSIAGNLHVPEPGEPPADDGEAAAAIAEARVVRAMAQLDRHQVGADAARTALARALIRSPIDGVVVTRDLEPGELVRPHDVGRPLFVLAPESARVRLVATVDEEHVASVRPGAVSFTVRGLPGRSFEGQVRQALAWSDEGRGFRVVVDADDQHGALRAGMSALLSLPMESGGGGLAVPAAALRFSPEPPADGASVWVRGADGRPARVPVRVGVRNGDMVEVIGARLRPGTPVLVAAVAP